ncbi:MAG: hypothetical protein LBK04_04475 [Clostridiales Family XIII bacterium]|jgi:uncharacterized membrane protein YcgQ (UPF0703/DUF1980 family)|nr:hypothetical protein [Clostridiales Family XIII bacterium]
MKKIMLLAGLCLILALSGCQQKSGIDQTARNGNGTPAVNLPKIEEVSGEDVGDTASGNPSDEVVEIKEKMFIAQANDIFYNAEDYLGKTIKYEGIFTVYEEPETGNKYYAVIRYGPGCCGIDANAGFEVLWGNEYPSQNDWVEAVGILEEYEEGGNTFLRLALSSLTVLPVRGAEYVSQ